MSIFDTLGYNQDYGFSQFNGAEAVREFKTTHTVKQSTLMQGDELAILREEATGLITELVEDIIVRKIPKITIVKEPLNGNLDISVELLVAPPGMKMLNVNNDTFFCESEQFTEEELARAVKIAFPERFV